VDSEADNAVFSVKLTRIKISLYGNGMCSFYVSLQNGFIQETRDFILLSCDGSFIKSVCK